MILGVSVLRLGKTRTNLKIIGALCEVMSTIVGAPNEFSYDTQSDFFAQHMGSWMTEFFDDLIKARESGFYRVVGEFGKAFIEIEKQYFDMEI